MKQNVFQKTSRGGFITYGIVIAFFVVFQALIATKHLSNNFKGQLIPICAYVIMARVAEPGRRHLR